MDTTTATATALRVRATFHAKYLGANDYELHPETPQGVELSGPELPTREAAEEWAAQFPQSVRFRVRSCGWLDGSTTYSAGTGLIQLAANGVNGGVNETGLRRYRSAVRTAERLGLDVEFGAAGTMNAYADRATFEAAVA